IPVVFSGRPEIDPDPEAAILGESYDLTVRDVQNHNPLAPGTSIQVEAEGTKVKAVGSTEITLDDTAFSEDNNDGFGREDIANLEETTDFNFRVVEDLEADEGGEPKIEAVTITVDGPNGSVEVVLLPEEKQSTAFSASRVLTPTPGATVHQTPSGETVVRAPKEQ
ncbi:MAG: hypothetical protein BRD51_05755, partial [Bacteroidetes bacterium SW_11_64_17]